MRLLRTVPSRRRTRVRRSDRVPFLELVEPRLLPANMVFIVNSAADPSGPTPNSVTLRDAINKVNNDLTDVASNPDVIKFAISGTPTITLAADLPALTAPVFIDGGESQPGYSGTPLIQIDGHRVQGSGLTLSPGFDGSTGSDGSTIRGLDIYGFSQGAGLLIQSSKNVIESSYLGTDGTRTIEEPNKVGVVISGTNPLSVPKSNTFTGCTFSGNSFGVYMSSANSNTFTGCTFSGNSFDGVFMNNVTSNKFTGCTFSGITLAGVFMSSAYYNTFTDCAFSENLFDGVFMSSAYDNTFTDCAFSGSTFAGVYMPSGDSNNFTGCTFSGSTFAGVYTSSAYDNTFTDCAFSGNSVDGVFMDNPTSNKFTGCTFSGNKADGVYMPSGDSNNFTGCTFTENSFDGLEISESSSNIVTGCTFTGNLDDGVYMSSANSKSDSNTFTGCNFTGNSVDGLEISGSSSNTVTGCTIAGNNNAGIVISSMSKYNVIDENDIGTPSNGSSTQLAGILINDSINNTIGGTTAGSTTPANVIGGNNVGIEITGFNSLLTGGNVIEGNCIGVTEDRSPIGNYYGIWINDVPNNLIGGTAKGAGNTISDNKWAGVYISGHDATGNLVEGNSILGPNNKRTKTDPTNPLPVGVFIQNS